ncbi:MAG: c-type cytochrome [Bacteroidetes bacterium]|nr:c-type cytochrome [Bacteroidota bacterium]
MKNILFYVFFVLLLLVFSFKAIEDFSITEKEVEIKIPQSFPKPVYEIEKNKPTPRIFYLGRKLFYDPILSLNNTISCGSCHQQFAAFAQSDHALSHGIDGLFGLRNAPALQNLIWNKTFMWDGGVTHLDLQPITPITSNVEMGETLEGVLKKLRANKEYTSLFKAAYGDTAITSERFLKSISQFLMLLISSNSRYDKYIQHKDTFSLSEKRGLKLFRKNCASCHKEPLFTDNLYHNNGLSIDSVLRDSARYRISGKKEDILKFKVPSLRNVAVSAPYMHDGRFYSLTQVLNHYTQNFVTKEADALLKKGIELNTQDKKDIIAFLKTLTDASFLRNPLFANPNYGYTPVTKKERNEEEWFTYYTRQWSETQLQYADSIPQYESYVDSLERILNSLKNKRLKKLETLRNTLAQSTKHKEAIEKYIKYGQPTRKQLLEPCIAKLQNDNIVKSTIKGVGKKGWLVCLLYTQKGVAHEKTLEVQYKPLEKIYFITNNE